MIFYLNVRTRGCTAEIRLNDAPIFAVHREAAQQAFPTVSEWVIAGENTLSVDLIEIEEGARLRVALCEGTIGAVPEPGFERELVVIEWPTAPELPTMPLSLREVGLASHPWGEWAWQVAPEFAADLRTTADVIAYVRSLHAELAAGRAGGIEALIDHSAVKFDEVAPAYAMTVAEAQQRLRGAWAALSSTPGWRLAPFDESDVELRLHCDGRLVEPTTLAGEPILRQLRAIDGELWSLPIFIARTNWEYTAGQLTIVR